MHSIHVIPLKDGTYEPRLRSPGYPFDHCFETLPTEEVALAWIDSQEGKDIINYVISSKAKSVQKSI